MLLGVRASEIMGRYAQNPEGFFQSARYKAMEKQHKLAEPSNWYRIRQYAKEMLKA